MFIPNIETSSSYRIYHYGISLQKTFQGYEAKIDQTVNTSFFRLKVSEVALNILTLVTTPLVYPVLGFLNEVGKVLTFAAKFWGRKELEAFLKGEELKNQIQSLRQGNQPDWKQATVKLIRQARYEEPSLELIRLKAVNALNPMREKKFNSSVEKALKNPYSALFPSEKQLVIQAKSLMGQALEIKDIYQSTHHVFIHAQAINWIVFSVLVKECIKKFHPDKDVRNFKFLRNPMDEGLNGTVKTFFGFLGIKNSKTDLQQYLNIKRGKVNDEKSSTRTKVLSVDAYFYNYQAGESSLSFMINNASALKGIEVIKALSDTVIRQFCPSIKQSDKERLLQNIEKIWNSLLSGSCGNLFTICVPKDQSPEVQYRAHAYGSACECHKKERAIKILEHLQAEKDINSEVQCQKPKDKKKEYFPIPQYRIFMPVLQPGRGIDIHLLSPMFRKEKQRVKQAIRAIAKEVYDLAHNIN